MYRRDFLKLLTAAGVVSGVSSLSHPLLAGEPIALPIPPLLKPSNEETVTLTLQTGSKAWFPNKTTQTWGVNGALLGPAIGLQRGQSISVQVVNQLPESSTLHWHGLEIAGQYDGGPQTIIEPGKRWQAELKIDQPAATCWFHPHTHMRTGYQVAMGLGGLLIIQDEVSQALPLPNTWGVDDIPLILQDKKLGNEGQIDYQLDVMTAAVGWFGELMLTNGEVYPRHVAPRGWLRLRLLNGSNARTLNIAMSDGRPFYVIASDGGLLPEPVKVTELPLWMGERFEVLVDTADGQPFDVVTLPVSQMGMTLPPFDQPLPLLRVAMTLSSGVTQMADKLVTVPAIPALEGIPQRHLQLAMDPRLDMQGMMQLMKRYGTQAMAGMHASMMSGQGGMQGHSMKNMHSMHNRHSGMGDMATRPPLDLMQANTINQLPYDMQKPQFDVPRGRWERWVISGVGDMMLHPFHIHGTQFRILSENGAPPPRHRQGWKDIVQVNGDVSEVLVRFPHTAPQEHAYMAHCHLLEHEDTGMMMAFTVSEPKP